MVSLVYSGVADIGVGDFTVTKERSEVVAFTDTVEISRYGIMLLYILQEWLVKFNLLKKQSADWKDFIPAALSLLFISAKYRGKYFPNYVYALLPSSFHKIRQWERHIFQCSFFLLRKTWEPLFLSILPSIRDKCERRTLYSPSLFCGFPGLIFVYIFTLIIRQS